MTEREFILALRRILLSALDLIDRRYSLGKYALTINVETAAGKQPDRPPVALKSERV